MIDATRSRTAALPTVILGLMVVACVALFLARAWHLVHAPLHAKLAVMPDDAFYYLGIAQHIAAGDGSTFDGLNPTNGYHPLWMALLVPLATVVGPGLTLVTAAQVLSLVLHAAGSVMLWQLLRGVVGARWAMLSSSLWLLAPWGLVQAAQGMESSLYQVCVFTLLLVHQVVDDRRAAGAPLPTLAYGCAMAAVVLARTDGVVLCALSVSLLASRIAMGQQFAARYARQLVAAAMWGVLCWGPWALVSVYTVRTILQDSAAMKSLWRAHGATLFGPSPGAFDLVVGRWFNEPLTLLTGGVLPDAALIAGKSLLAGGVVYTLLLRRADRRRRDLLGLVVAWACLSGVAFGAALGDIQLWHLVPAAIALFLTAVLLAPAVSAGQHHDPRPDFAPVPALALTVFYALMTWQTLQLQPRFYPWQVDVYDSLSRFDRYLAPADRVGAFNAGIPGFFSSRPVINLDGLVNHSILEYWRAGRWDAYLVRAGITHIADEASSLRRAERFSAGRVELIPVDEHVLKGWPDGRRVLWRIASEARRDRVDRVPPVAAHEPTGQPFAAAP